MGKKIIRLTESDLTKLIKRVIQEQKKFDLFVTQGSNAEANLSKNVLTITTESGRQQKFLVKTSLPQGGFMFEYGKDGRYYGWDAKTNKKHEIILLKQVV